MPLLTYCPVCGHALSQREEGGRLRPACVKCGYVHYVNPVPGVGLLIEMDGGLVLIQRGNAPHKGEWTLPSGFVEADESAEEAAVREAEEETGLIVEIIELAGVNSFPEGPPVSGIMIFYRMRPVGGRLLAGDDAQAVQVFKPDEMPLLPFRTHREMVAEWLARFHHGALNRDLPPAEPQAFIIRPFEANDLDEVLALLAMIPANRHMTDDQWRDVALRLREAPGVEVFVAQITHAPSLIIGFVALSVVRTLTEGRGFISDMAVLPTYQGRGVGTKLLEMVIRRASQISLTTLLVNTERANDRVRALYARSGFDETPLMLLKLR